MVGMLRLLMIIKVDTLIVTKGAVVIERLMI